MESSAVQSVPVRHSVTLCIGNLVRRAENQRDTSNRSEVMELCSIILIVGTVIQTYTDVQTHPTAYIKRAVFDISYTSVKLDQKGNLVNNF